MSSVTSDFEQLARAWYTGAMSEEPRSRLAEGRRSLMDAIAGLDEEGFRRRAAQGEWTVAETLAHLLEVERFLTAQIKQARSDGSPSIPSRTDEQRNAAAKQAQRMPVPQIVHALLAQRRDTLRQLDGMPEEQLARALRHPRWGEVDVRWLFQHIAAHEAEHAAQIQALRERIEVKA